MKVKQFFDKWLPLLWGVLWVLTITLLSLSAVGLSIKWLLQLLGVM